MPPKKTYELRISFPQSSQAMLIKEQVKSWLSSQGIDTFVEGSLDDLNIDHDYEQNDRDFYSELGGQESPLSLFSYHLEYLDDLNGKLLQYFKQQIVSQIESMETKVWMEGWKESFKPIKTERFYIYPPWEALKNFANQIPLVIDPGMAFGTGQHATTQVCIQEMERLYKSMGGWQDKRILDVGAGSGILSIAAAKLGCQRVDGCDIEIDAVSSARANSQANQVSPNFWQGSLPSQNPGNYNLVIANILFVVLSKIIAELAAELCSGGTLLLSGLLVEQRQPMLDLAQAQGLVLKSEFALDGWQCLTMEKK